MKKKATHFIGIMAVVALALGCAFITVNITFEQAKEKIGKDAEKITKMVRDASAVPEDSDKDGFGEFSALKQRRPVDSTIKNPKLRAIIESIKARARHLAPARQNGHVGENNRGYLDIFKSAASLAIQLRAKVTQLVAAENKDRHQLYIEECKAHGLNPTAENVEKTGREFAKRWASVAGAGEWIQQPDGKWIKK